jgi:hypothetical protein
VNATDDLKSYGVDHPENNSVVEEQQLLEVSSEN